MWQRFHLYFVTRPNSLKTERNERDLLGLVLQNIKCNAVLASLTLRGWCRSKSLNSLIFFWDAASSTSELETGQYKFISKRLSGPALISSYLSLSYLYAGPVTSLRNMNLWQHSIQSFINDQASSHKQIKGQGTYWGLIIWKRNACCPGCCASIDSWLTVSSFLFFFLYESVSQESIGANSQLFPISYILIVASRSEQSKTWPH